MAEKAFPMEDTAYTAEDAQLWFATRTSGVYANDHLPVSAGDGLNVIVGPGIAWLKYGAFGGLAYGNTDNLVKAVTLSDANYTRIDRVCIRYDVILNTCGLVIKQGTPASNAEPPALTRDETAYEISIAKITLAPGVTEITADMITDERLDEEVCGLMSDGVTGIGTSVMHAQFAALLKEIQTNLQAIYEGVEKVNIIERSATLLASGWSAEEPYTQSVTVEGVLGSDAPFVDVDLSAAVTLDEIKALLAAWASVLKATAEANQVTVIFGNVPDMDVPIKVKVVR